MGYLPDPRRLWAWGIVFGGQFYDPEAKDSASSITADSPEVLAALEWMASYSRRYGVTNVASFRSGEQALTGSVFPLLADRRYAVIMDGQWRVRDIATAAKADQAKSTDKFAVVPLPPPPSGRKDAGWVNGNFFVIPRRANCKEGAWEFMKFWTGFGGTEAHAAKVCAAGGWIPPSQKVVVQPDYQQALEETPLLRQFVRLARSPNQIPVPSLPVSSIYYQEVNRAAQEVMYRGEDPSSALQQAAGEVRERLRELADER